MHYGGVRFRYAYPEPNSSGGRMSHFGLRWDLQGQPKIKNISWLFTNFLTDKIFLYPQDQKINGMLDKGFFSFLLSLSNANTNLTLNEIKKKKKRVYLYFHTSICVINMVRRVFWYFHIDFWIFEPENYVQIWSFIVSLYAQPCSLPQVVVRGGGW
jgi:hypothetical protein